MPPIAKRSSKYTHEQLLNMKRSELTSKLTDREVAFSEYYIQDYNVLTAAIKAGYNTGGGNNKGNKVRNRPQVVDYIAWLKVHLYEECMIEANDIINAYARMASYNITDYLEMKGNRLKLKDFDKLDGRIIQEISQNVSGGITVKFPDRLKAWDRLNDFMAENPLDWKRVLEERKVKIMEEKLELEKEKFGLSDTIEDDGFLKALEAAAQAVYIQNEISVESEDEKE